MRIKLASQKRADVSLLLTIKREIETPVFVKHCDCEFFIPLYPRKS